jgi:hypothetical protein
MLGGHIIQAQQYHGGPQGQQASVKNYPNGNNN